MKKDKEWLKNEISEKWLKINGDKVINLNWLNLLIDQLDEPKKVTVPNWFDEWMKKKVGLITDRLDLAYCIVDDLNAHRLTSEQKDYIIDHSRDILSALLHGYGVKKEKLYWVRDKNGNSLIYRDPMDNELKHSHGNGIWLQEIDNKRYQFTEQEIKDYDERYIPFMVPVEEVDNE